MIAGAAAVSSLIGAVIGAVVWRFKKGLLWAGLAVGLYVLLGPTLLNAPLRGVARFGLPPLVLALLAAYVTGRSVGTSRRLNRFWAMIVALGAALLVATLYLRSFMRLMRADTWLPFWVAVIADAVLLVLAIIDLAYRSNPRPYSGAPGP